MAIYGYTKNYKLIKPKYDTDTWHDYEYDNLDTIDAVLSAIYASGDWQGFWKSNTHYNVGDIVIDRDTDTMYKVMVEHTTSAGSFAAEWTAHHNYYELWSPNDLAESWATKTDGKVSDTDYSSKAYAISSGLINDGSAKEWAVKTGKIGNTNEYSAKKYATDAHNDYISMTTNPNVAAVGSNINNVNAVGQSISNVNTVAGNVSSVNTVAGMSTDVTTVVGISTDVSTVANNSANVTTVATNISDVNTAASNISTIRYAPTAATNAAQYANDASSNARASASSATSAAQSATASATSANNSHIWAEGTDAQVAALGGVHSSKGWAEQSTSVNISLTNSPYTTNRILEIPQDIKLEIDSNGKCWLKAGSKCYKPNGTVINIVNDIAVGRTATTQEFIGVTGDGLRVGLNVQPSRCYSGATAPTGFSGYGLWLDTNSMTYKFSLDGGSTWNAADYSLPIALVTMKNVDGEVASIDQVFNGLGYIGGTVFALPGVQVQTPNGKNADGTYKSVIRTIDSVRTYDAGAWGTRNLNIFFSGDFDNTLFGTLPTDFFTYNKKFSSDTNTVSYDENTGMWWQSPDQSSWYYIAINIVGSVTVTSGKITSFEPYTVDSIVNSNASNFSQAGRSYLSGLGMPSNRYIDLTLGAKGSTYTAPANGWFVLQCEVTGNNKYFTTRCKGSDYGFVIPVYTGGGSIPVRTTIPCLKGSTYIVSYNVTVNSTTRFRFIYAEGENNV